MTESQVFLLENTFFNDPPTEDDWVEMESLLNDIHPSQLQNVIDGLSEEKRELYEEALEGFWDTGWVVSNWHPDAGNPQDEVTALRECVKLVPRSLPSLKCVFEEIEPGYLEVNVFYKNKLLASLIYKPDESCYGFFGPTEECYFRDPSDFITLLTKAIDA